MLHTNHGVPQIQMTVFNPSLNQSTESEITPFKAPCPTTEKLMELFEQATGWKVEFAESESSLQRRKCDSSDGIAQGSFSIVDMSENWPPQKPTSHRGKCDEMVALMGQLVGQIQATQLELVQAQSALAGFDPNVNMDEVELVDSFVPKFGRRSTDKVRSKDRVRSARSDSFLTTTAAKDDREFEMHQPLADQATQVCSEQATPVSPPFEGWSFGGATGIVDNFYLDWMVDNDERISICAGQIDTEVEVDLESKICIDPLTNEYWFKETESCTTEMPNPDESSQMFYLWDSDSSSLTPISRSKFWTRLNSQQAIVATTATKLSEMSCWKNLDQGYTTASEIASMLRSSFCGKDPLLVLKRS